MEACFSHGIKQCKNVNSEEKCQNSEFRPFSQLINCIFFGAIPSLHHNNSNFFPLNSEFTSFFCVLLQLFLIRFLFFLAINQMLL